LPAFDAMAALEAWIKMVSDKKAGVECLRAIIAERLVRLLCPTCKQPYQPDEAMLRKMNLNPGRNLQSFKENTEPLRDPKGNPMTCPDCCGTGYRGRTGIFEVLTVTPEMKKAIIAGADLNAIKAMARKNNMTILFEHGFRKFAAGLTSIKEIARVMTPEKGGSGPSSASGISPSPR